MLRDISFRSRPIDVNRPIPIYRDLPEDDRDYGASGLSGRSVPQMPTGMEAEEEEEAHIAEAIKRSTTQDIHIPIPDVIIVDGWDTETTEEWHRPTNYIRYRDPYLDPDWVEYDLEPEDMDFLEGLNFNKEVLTVDQLESAIEKMEREADIKFNSEVPPASALEDLLGLPSHVFLAVYNHWKFRRETERMPLIYRYLRPPDPEDQSPYRAFRIRVEERNKKKTSRNDQSAIVKMRQLRQEMERARTLFEMIKKRERHKKEMVEWLEQGFTLQCLYARMMPAIETASQRKRRKIRAIRDMEMELEGAISDSEIEEQSELSEPDTSNSEDDEAPSPVSPRRHLPGVSSYSSAIFPFSTHLGNLTNFNLGPKLPPFRGRARLGRGGRVIFDRNVGAPAFEGVCYNQEQEEENSSRIGSLVALYRSGYHPVAAGTSDADALLKKLRALNKKRGRDPDANIDD